MPTAKTLFFTEAKKTEIREVRLPPISAEEVLVETICSAISAGSEMLIYRGQFPQLKDTHDNLSSDLNYPLAYGYCCVGRVTEVGKKKNEAWLNQLVFAFQPHASHLILNPADILPLPAGLSPESACFLPNMETAVNLVQDGAPLLGEQVLVMGQGVVGLLTASLLSEFPLERLVTVDQHELRRRALGKTWVQSVAPNTLQPSTFDLTFEVSGSPSALNEAIALTTFSGRVVIGSWYGKKQAEINLGGAFHRSRIKLIASQVSSISPEISGRWDKTRRFDVVWKALERIKPERWITHRFPIAEADKAYQLLDKNPQDTIQVIFTYST